MPRVGHSPTRVFLLTRAVHTHELVGRQLRPATEQESALFLVSLDPHGKVDEFGFAGSDDDG